MITKALVEYVNGQRTLGKLDVEIKQDLIKGGGWTPSDIEELFTKPKLSKNSKNALLNGLLFLLVLPPLAWFVLIATSFDILSKDLFSVLTGAGMWFIPGIIPTGLPIYWISLFFCYRSFFKQLKKDEYAFTLGKRLRLLFWYPNIIYVILIALFTFLFMDFL